MASVRCSFVKVFNMGFTTSETQVSEGPDGNTVETKVPGTSLGDRLGGYAQERAPIMSQLLGFAPDAGAPRAPSGYQPAGLQQAPVAGIDSALMQSGMKPPDTGPAGELLKEFAKMFAGG